MGNEIRFDALNRHYCLILLDFKESGVILCSGRDICVCLYEREREREREHKEYRIQEKLYSQEQE